MAVTELQRFWAKVIRRDINECWGWTGTISSSGYGLFWPTQRETWNAHRYMYGVMNSFEELEGKDIHHTCRNRVCVNPLHLVALTEKEHGKESPKALQEFCINGHEFTRENTYIKPNGCRDCNECKRIRYERWRYKAK